MLPKKMVVGSNNFFENLGFSVRRNGIKQGGGPRWTAEVPSSEAAIFGIWKQGALWNNWWMMWLIIVSNISTLSETVLLFLRI